MGIQSHHFMANQWEKEETVTDFIFLGSKITVNHECIHAIKRHLLLGRKAITNLVVIQLLSHVWLCDSMERSTPGFMSFAISWSLLRLMSIELMMPSNHLKSRDITLLTKVHIVKPMVFLVVMQGCESWTRKKAEPQRIDAFRLWCWRRPFRAPCTERRST